jgi:hypothetical protein
MQRSLHELRSRGPQSPDSGMKQRIALVIDKLKFTTFVVDHPWIVVGCTVLMWLAVIVLLVVISPLLKVESGWRAEGTQSAINEDTHDTALSLLVTPNSTSEAERSTRQVFMLMFYADKKGENVFTEDNIAYMKFVEDIFLLNSQYEDFCWTGGTSKCLPAFTILNYFYPTKTNGQITAYDAGGTELEDIKDTLSFLANATNMAKTGAAFFFDKKFAPDHLESAATRSLFFVGLPLNGFDRAVEKPAEQNAKIDDWAIDNFLVPLQFYTGNAEMFVYHYSNGLTNEEITIVLVGDLSISIVAITFVACYMSFHTQSAVLGCAGMLHIVMSIFCGLFIYTYFFMIQFVGVMLGLVVFIMLGIGADDVFVFTDAWKQSATLSPEISGDVYRRMDWALKHSASAMLVTSFTTMAAFLANVFSSVPAIRLFGVFAALVILSNYLLVITYFPAIVIILHKKGACPSYCKSCFQRRHPRLASAEDVMVGEKEDGECSFESTPEIDADEENASMEVLPVIGVVLPAMVESEEKASKWNMESDQGHENEEQLLLAESESPPFGITSYFGDLSQALSGFFGDVEAQFRTFLNVPPHYWEGAHPQGLHQRRTIERVFFQLLSPLIFKWRYSILAGFAIIILVFCSVGLTIQLGTERPNALKKHHPLNVAFDLQANTFRASSESDVYQVSLMWGAKGVERVLRPSWAGFLALQLSELTGLFIQLDTEDVGDPIWDDSWDITAPTAQEEVLTFIAELRKQTNLVRNGEIKFFLEQVKTDRLKNSTFPIPQDQFDDYLRGWVRQNSRTYGTQVGYVKEEGGGEKLRFARALVNMTLPLSAELDEVYESYQKWQDYFEATTPNLQYAGNFFHHFGWWPWVITMRVLAQGAVFGIVLSSILTFLVLLVTTLNIWLTIFSSLTIFGIVSCILGEMVLLGWELGLIESISITVLVGLSVDYVVHYAKSYNDSPRNWTPYQRMRHALTEMGISILSGAVTSVGAALILLLTVIQFFVKFGFFLLSTILLSIVFATFFFSALCMAFGPTGNSGDISYLMRRIVRSITHRIRRKGRHQ